MTRKVGFDETLPANECLPKARPEPTPPTTPPAEVLLQGRLEREDDGDGTLPSYKRRGSFEEDDPLPDTSSRDNLPSAKKRLSLYLENAETGGPAQSKNPVRLTDTASREALPSAKSRLQEYQENAAASYRSKSKSSERESAQLTRLVAKQMAQFQQELSNGNTTGRPREYSINLTNMVGARLREIQNQPKPPKRKKVRKRVFKSLPKVFQDKAPKDEQASPPTSSEAAQKGQENDPPQQIKTPTGEEEDEVFELAESAVLASPPGLSPPEPEDELFDLHDGAPVANRTDRACSKPTQSLLTLVQQYSDHTESKNDQPMEKKAKPRKGTGVNVSLGERMKQLEKGGAVKQKGPSSAKIRKGTGVNVSLGERMNKLQREFESKPKPKPKRHAGKLKKPQPDEEELDLDSQPQTPVRARADTRPGQGTMKNALLRYEEAAATKDDDILDDCDDPPLRPRSNTKPTKSFETVMKELNAGIEDTYVKEQERREAFQKASEKEITTAVAQMPDDQKRAAAELLQKWSAARLDGGLTVDNIVSKLPFLIPGAKAGSPGEEAKLVSPDDLLDDTSFASLEDIAAFLVDNGHWIEQEGKLLLVHFPLFKILQSDALRHGLVWGLFVDFIASKAEILATALLVNIGLNDKMLASMLETLKACKKLKVLNLESNDLTHRSLDNLIDEYLYGNKNLEEFRLANQFHPVATATCQKMVAAVKPNRTLLRFTMDFRERHLQDAVDRTLQHNLDALRKARLKLKAPKVKDVAKLYDKVNQAKGEERKDTLDMQGMRSLRIRRTFTEQEAGWFIEGVVERNPKRILMNNSSISNGFLTTYVGLLLARHEREPEAVLLESLRLDSNDVYGEGMEALARLIDAKLPHLIDVQAKNQSKALGTREGELILDAVQGNYRIRKLGFDVRTAMLSRMNRLLSRNANQRWQTSPKNPIPSKKPVDGEPSAPARPKPNPKPELPDPGKAEPPAPAGPLSLDVDGPTLTAGQEFQRPRMPARRRRKKSSRATDL